ncbi:MAG: Uma2 family endonuclease [Actinomycetota bacterium]|nr:Uma2 family endonuclease [Actinomycetota bacterium]
MAHPVTTGSFTVDDLDWLRDEMHIAAHLELDPWGNLIVSPASDEHEMAWNGLHQQASRQLADRGYTVLGNGFAWCPTGGSRYVNLPDLTILAPGWRRVDDVDLDPPPLLVVEVASPSTRTVDRTRKLADYRLGGARLYLLVDLPSTFERHDFSTGEVVTAEGAIALVVGDQPVRFELP